LVGFTKVKSSTGFPAARRIATARASGLSSSISGNRWEKFMDDAKPFDCSNVPLLNGQPD
jgi:hypothetical protein